MEIIEVLLEIVKITVPALIVFFTVYYLMKRYLNTQIQIKSMEIQKDKASHGAPMKLQALERLSVFMERINPSNLILRIRTPSMSSGDLMNAMLIAVQQEYEHNISQQVYVSDNLWEIVMLTKHNITNVITMAGASIPENGSQTVYVDKIFEILNQNEADLVKTAQSSIRKEASLLL